MVLKALYEGVDEIPEAFRELYTERGGKYELTGVEGMKTQADVDRLQTALTKERGEHKATKEKLAAWGDLEPEDTREKLDKIPELEARAGQVDDEKIEKLVEARAAAKVRTLEREHEKLKTESDGKDTRIALLETRERQRAIGDAILPELGKAKVLDSAREDILMLADRIFEAAPIEGEEGRFKVTTRDGVGVTPGISPADWIAEMQPKRPHWWPPSEGAGGRPGTSTTTGNNPWQKSNWNITEQSRVFATQGAEVAERMAKQAGTTVGGPRPA